MTSRRRIDSAALRASPAFRLIDRRRCIRLTSLVFARVAVGFLDLLLAAALYLLFLRLQSVSPIKHSRWTPHTILATVALTGALVVIRALLDVLSTWLASRQIQGLYNELLLRLIHGYSKMRWERFVERNRSELLNHATHVAREAADFYHRWVEFIASTIVVIIMAAALFYQSPIAASALCASVILFYILHRSAISARLQRAAFLREQSMRDLQKDIADVLSAGREIRAYRNHAFFFRRISQHSGRLSECNLRIVILPQIVRILADQGVTLLFLCIVAAVELKHGDTRQLLSLLVFYFALSRRLLPLISQIFFILGQMEGSYENVLTVDSELQDCLRNEIPVSLPHLPSGYFALEMRLVTYSFDPNAPILQHVSLHLRVGQTMVLRGVSGSGKTSLLNIIAGVSQPTSGTVYVDRARIAYVPQEILLLDDTIRNNLLFGLPAKSDAEIRRALTAARLEDFVALQPLGLETEVGDNGILFSGGERQRLGVARAILRGADLLLLDEATSALDEENERQLLENVRVSGVATILVTHRLHKLPIAQREFLLQGGRLIEHHPTRSVGNDNGVVELEEDFESKLGCDHDAQYLSSSAALGEIIRTGCTPS